MNLENKHKIARFFKLPNDFTLRRFLQFKKRMYGVEQLFVDFAFYFPNISFFGTNIVYDDSFVEIQRRFLKQEESFNKFMIAFRENSFLECNYTKNQSRKSKKMIDLRKIKKLKTDSNPLNSKAIKEYCPLLSKTSALTNKNCEINDTSIPIDEDNHSFSETSDSLMNARKKVLNIENHKYKSTFIGDCLGVTVNSANQNDKNMILFNSKQEKFKNLCCQNAINKYQYTKDDYDSKLEMEKVKKIKFNEQAKQKLQKDSSIDRFLSHAIHSFNKREQEYSYSVPMYDRERPMFLEPKLNEYQNHLINSKLNKGNSFKKIDSLPFLSNKQSNYFQSDSAVFQKKVNCADIRFKPTEKPDSFVYSCFKTFKFNSLGICQNMMNKIEHREEILDHDFSALKKKTYLFKANDNKNIISFVKSVIDSSIILGIGENSKSSFEQNQMLISNLIKTEERLNKPGHRLLNYSSARKPNNTNSDQDATNNRIYTHNEILQLLNLKTIKFTEMLGNPLKIAEASFSEVFNINGLIYKIIPFNEWYGIEEFCTEVFILETLKEEKGVCKLEDKFLLKGAFTEPYLKAWESFQGTTENLNPKEYKDDQVYGVLVMKDCGVDLEKYQFKTYSQFIDFIHQLLSIICNLESKYNFEHRDMHWGNIMIKDQQVFIVDFNFSRLEKEKIIYTNLNDHSWIFEGDGAADIQFVVYKDIRDSCNSNWISFNPKSNLMWIRYILKKLILKASGLDNVKYKNKILKILQKISIQSNEYSNCHDFFKWFLEFEKHIQIN